MPPTSPVEAITLESTSVFVESGKLDPEVGDVVEQVVRDRRARPVQEVDAVLFTRLWQDAAG